MTNPVRKVEIWHDGALLHDVTQDTRVIDVETAVTDALGKFQIILSEGSGITFTKYNDISQFDDVHIWLGYDSLDENPLFKGKIDVNYSYLAGASGYLRTIQGYDYGEILKRKLKTKRWHSIGASTIVTELADDLSLGTGSIEADATSLTIEACEKKYFDILREISYIRDKDFYVDNAKALHWFTRQSAGTCSTTLKEKDNVLTYDLKRNIQNVANIITVKGKAEVKKPANDSWCEEEAGGVPDEWTVEAPATLELDALTKKKGSYGIAALAGVGGTLTDFKLDIPQTGIESITKLHLWQVPSSECTGAACRLWAPDSSNRFNTILDNSPDDWYEYNLDLGPTGEYDATDNPDGPWTITGNPNWYDLEYIRFYFTFNAGDLNSAHVDDIYFYWDRWSNTQEGAASKAAYGDRELTHICDYLRSNAECQDYATSLLGTLENPVYHLGVSIPGDTSIIVGKLVNVDIPSRALDTTFDVIRVKHHFEQAPIGFQTQVVTSGYKQVRSPVAGDIGLQLARLNEKALLSLRGIQRK